MLGHRHPLEQWRVPHLGLPLAWVLEARASKQTWRASTLQMGIQPEKKRTRKDHTGETSLSRNWSVLYFPGKLFILLVVHRDQWIIQSHAGFAALTLITTRLFLQLETQVLGDLHHLLTRRSVSILWPYSDKSGQPENLFALKVLFFLKSGATLRKH